MKWSRISTLSLMLLRVVAIALLIGISFMFVGWSILSSRTSGIALVTLTAIIVLVLSAAGSFNHSPGAAQKRQH